MYELGDSWLFALSRSGNVQCNDNVVLEKPLQPAGRVRIHSGDMCLRANSTVFSDLPVSLGAREKTTVPSLSTHVPFGVVLQFKQFRLLADSNPINAIGKRLPNLRIVSQRRSQNCPADATHSLHAYGRGLTRNAHVGTAGEQFLFQSGEIASRGR
jgi:hypothetical protein